MRIHRALLAVVLLATVSACGAGLGTQLLGGKWYHGEWTCWVDSFDRDETSALTVGDGTWTLMLYNPQGSPEKVSGTWELDDGELVITNPGGVREDGTGSLQFAKDLEMAVPLDEEAEPGSSLEQVPYSIRSKSEGFDVVEGTVTGRVSDKDDPIVIIDRWGSDQDPRTETPYATYACEQD